ncbi:2OG-Fe dioxygenase family protein [Streptomyces otsuchiensis]|uniref:2OG-Fe dioxygenase family protein n=1 Tax=Streptomyces otsuchiensis TaxID=2681388 RepID=UPI001D130C20|nr:2OG-Fe dioxygenase family protein [Streptomyces otsuchiensis]
MTNGGRFAMSVLPSELAKNGYDRWDLLQHFGLTETDENYRALRAAYEDLPIDPYAPDSGRHRRYARGVFLPWSREFFWMPASRSHALEGMNGYYQGDNNPEYVNVVRSLPAISQEVCDNPLLLDMIQFDFEQTRWSEDDAVWPLYVGIHLIKLRIEDEDGEAVSSPNELHQDGEPYVFAHMIYRENAEGGNNVIATPAHRGKQPEEVPAHDILAEFDMRTPLEAYGITDHLVSHYVAPIRKGSEPGPGERAILLADWVPMRHRI